ncbi:MAG TPA: YeeE/YedE thiosulfate transporter family protein [Candidatus Omnitrophota bacterium]|nr:YeeE/YedE family protein [Candidatus Omnitrophota bacterium]HPB67931.1 YeeE/YedE thiosulfate transporter family protein [Candidatus Omnitrophota bacterium]HQO58690.1 YeeE/YedE thiosulfate transporter family protein [Candidatus Omnitrophota bacterium]HQP11748.1 YeeE/YedE thiosulfate transporter family protein [Candidatus Omnitrophota bacterium]
MKGRTDNRPFMVAGFAGLNVLMCGTIQKFWIGGSSFLPMIGQMGPDKKFLFSFVVNLGVITGAFLGAVSHGEFRLRWPQNFTRAVAGGVLIGIGFGFFVQRAGLCFAHGLGEIIIGKGKCVFFSFC